MADNQKHVCYWIYKNILIRVHGKIKEIVLIIHAMDVNLTKIYEASYNETVPIPLLMQAVRHWAEVSGEHGWLLWCAWTCRSRELLDAHPVRIRITWRHDKPAAVTFVNVHIPFRPCTQNCVGHD
jgi:hypothetical protein